jgi:hypothetical protein
MPCLIIVSGLNTSYSVKTRLGHIVMLFPVITSIQACNLPNDFVNSRGLPIQVYKFQWQFLSIYLEHGIMVCSHV